MRGHVFKRCPCAVVRDDRGHEVPCPKAHGSRAWVADVPAVEGQRRRQQSKAGYTTKKDAEVGLRAYMTLADTR